jgi:hypothetical protein
MMNQCTVMAAGVGSYAEFRRGRGIIARSQPGWSRQLAVEMVGQAISFDLSRNAVPVVIANATSAGDFDLKVTAEAYMHELGAKGRTRRSRSRAFSKAT